MFSCDVCKFNTKDIFELVVHAKSPQHEAQVRFKEENLDDVDDDNGNYDHHHDIDYQDEDDEEGYNVDNKNNVVSEDNFIDPQNLLEVKQEVGAGALLPDPDTLGIDVLPPPMVDSNGHVSNGDFYCDLCGYTCFKASTFKIHMSSKSHRARLTAARLQLNIDQSEDDDRSCKVCPHKCENVDALVEHIKRSHYSESARARAGDNAGKLLLKYMTDHEEQEGQVFSCPHCDKYKTSRGVNLRGHIARVHNINNEKGEKKEMKCTYCPFISHSREYLNRHMLRQHGHNASKICGDCGYKAKTEYHLKCHQSRVHNISGAFDCDQCDFKSDLERLLKTHKRTKHGVFSCHACLYTTSNRKFLMQHARLTHSDTYQKCEKCDFQSKNPSSLSEHFKRKHTDRIYQCDECTYTGNMMTDLTQHKKSMHEGRTYNCDLCPFETKFRGTLITHRRSVHSLPS